MGACVSTAASCTIRADRRTSQLAIHIPSLVDRLPYRYPSYLLDAIVQHEPGRRLVATKNVTINEDFFQGHFPCAPVMPGVLMI